MNTLRLWLKRRRPVLIVLPGDLSQQEAERLKAQIDLCVVPTRAQVDFKKNGG